MKFIVYCYKKILKNQKSYFTFLSLNKNANIQTYLILISILGVFHFSVMIMV